MQKPMSMHLNSTLSTSKLAQELINFAEMECCSKSSTVERFIDTLMDCNNPQSNAGVYNILVAFVMRLAIKESVNDADGEAVEACRKICDVTRLKT